MPEKISYETTDAVRDHAPLRTFVSAMTQLVEKASNEAERLRNSKVLLQQLIAADSWLPDFCAQTHAEHYHQYLVYADPLERFSVVSFVWESGQKKPVHDHKMWWVSGMRRGAETSMRYEHKTEGRLYSNIAEATLTTGDINTVSPSVGNIHGVSKYSRDSMVISIQAYDTNIGTTQRHVFDLATGLPKEFVYDYVADAVPNLWNLSKALCTSAGTFLNQYVAIACGLETRSHTETAKESWRPLRSNRRSFAVLRAASRDDERDGDLAAVGKAHYKKQPQDSSTRTPRPNVGGCPKPH